MMTLTIPDELEMPLSIAAKNKHMTPLDFVIGLLKRNFEQQAVQDEADALLIYEQLMEQYSETFEKLVSENEVFYAVSKNFKEKHEI